MCKFSNKYNIRIKSKESIISILLNEKEINKIDKHSIFELYFVKDEEFKNINDFKDIKEYAVIVKEKGKKQIVLHDKEIYSASLTNIQIVSELMLFYKYRPVFLIDKTIHEYSFNNITFYIQHINNNDYYLTFNIDTKEECINEIINLFKDKLNIILDDNLYFDIIQNEYYSSKK